MMLLCQFNRLFDQGLVQIAFQYDGINVLKDLVALLIHQIHQRQHIGPLGDGAGDVAVVVEHGQPGTHAVRNGHHIVAVDLVIAQLFEHGVAHGRIVYDAQICRSQFHIGNVLHDIARHTAVNIFHAANIASVGDVIILRETLDIHKCCTNDQNAHMICSFGSRNVISIIPQLW